MRIVSDYYHALTRATKPNWLPFQNLNKILIRKNWKILKDFLLNLDLDCGQLQSIVETSLQFI